MRSTGSILGLVRKQGWVDSDSTTSIRIIRRDQARFALVRGKKKSAMPNLPLFTDDLATDQGYINVRAAGDDRMRGVRENCELLWEFYEEHADNEFRTELRSNFDVRYWEMYLTTTLLLEGYEVKCPKPGPDVGIEIDGVRIWFEATSPTRGADGAADQVPEAKFDGKAYDVPNEKLVLRYLNSISE